MVTEVVFKDLKGIMNDKPIPWQTRSDPLIRFRTDEGLTYGVQFIQLSFVLDEENQALLVEGHPQGLIMIRGPACGELAEALASHQATMLRKDGEGITSVELLEPDDDDEEPEETEGKANL
jgi:hypothetical protein